MCSCVDAVVYCLELRYGVGNRMVGGRGGAGAGGLCVCMMELWIKSNNGSFLSGFLLL